MPSRFSKYVNRYTHGSIPLYIRPVVMTSCFLRSTMYAVTSLHALVVV